MPPKPIKQGQANAKSHGSSCTSSCSHGYTSPLDTEYGQICGSRIAATQNSLSDSRSSSEHSDSGSEHTSNDDIKSNETVTPSDDSTLYSWLGSINSCTPKKSCIDNTILNFDGLAHGDDFAGYANGALSLSCALFLNRWEMLALNLAFLAGASVMSYADMRICSSHNHDDPGNAANWRTEASAIGEFIGTWIKSFSLLAPTLDNGFALKSNSPLGYSPVVVAVGLFSLLPAFAAAYCHRNINKNNQENNDKKHHTDNADCASHDSHSQCDHNHEGADTWTRVAIVGVFLCTYFTQTTFFGQMLDQNNRWDAQTALGVSWRSAAYLAAPLLLLSMLATYCDTVVYTNHQQDHHHDSPATLKGVALTRFQSVALTAAGLARATEFAAAVALLDDQLKLSQLAGIPCYARNTGLLALGVVVSLGNVQTYRNNLKITIGNNDSANTRLLSRAV